MNALFKLITLSALTASNLFDVKIYNDQCQQQVAYVAEQVYVNINEGFIDIIQSTGVKVHIPFKYGVREAQVSYEKFFRSYQYENGTVSEKTTPYCTGSI